MNRTKGLKTVTGFKNMYEYNEKYVDAKAKFNMDRYNESNERQLKESFKCTFASDCRGFTDSLKGRVRISKVPDFIYLAMANAGIDEKK